MTDTELELACKTQFLRFPPWAYWTSEIYSIGKCLRYWTKYPIFLPLYVYSDHGVNLDPHLAPHELKSPAKVHLTWNPEKESRYNYLAGKKVIQIMNPWVAYRRMRRITRSEKTEGTLVFFSHSTPNVRWKGHDTKEYFSMLRELPEKFQPVVLCLHMHDIKAGVHKKLRRHGFPIVTAGNVRAVNFVDKFYDLVKNYSYATSQEWGSQVAYCVEFDVPYFFFGERAVLENIADNNLPLGKVERYSDRYHEELGEKIYQLFSFPVDKVTDKQRAIIESILGFGSSISRKQLLKILWREFSRNWWKFHLILPSMASAFLRKFKQLRNIKRLRQQKR